MKIVRLIGRLCAGVVAVSLAACGGGGGGNSLVTAPAPIPQVNIGTTGPIIFAPPGSVGASLASFPQATGTTPNFTNSFPAPGTVFPLLQTTVNVNYPNAVGTATTLGASMTVTGTQMVGGVPHAVLEFKIPEIGVDATGLIGDGSTVTLSDGRKLTVWANSLNYTALGAWNITPMKVGESGTYQFGIGASGYQTPTGNVPTGTATYTGNGTNGGVWGHVVAPSGTGSILINSVTGQASITVNFTSGTVNGSLTNMMVATGAGQPVVPWNNVSLTGNVSGASLSGTTASSGTAPGGVMGFAGSSTGIFNGALFGPNGEELGALWTLHDPTGQGKSAIGYVGATR